MTIVNEQPARNDPIGGFVVERVIREDGRYLLYYTWPAGAEAATDATGAPAGVRPAAPPHQPWSPEAGPPGDERDDV